MLFVAYRLIPAMDLKGCGVISFPPEFQANPKL